MNKTILKRIIWTILIILIVFETLLLILGIEVVEDKNAYILGLQSDRKVCNDKLDEQLGEYAKINNELKKYQRKYGEIE